MGFVTKNLKYVDGRNQLSNVFGKKVASQIDLGGQLVGDYNDLYKPKDVQPIPTDNGMGVDTGAASAVAADRARRLAKRAAGLDSTIRTSPTGATALYSPQPKALLGS